jgi:hypothetical protein
MGGWFSTEQGVEFDQHAKTLARHARAARGLVVGIGQGAGLRGTGQAKTGGHGQQIVKTPALAHLGQAHLAGRSFWDFHGDSLIFVSGKFASPTLPHNPVDVA